jgi:hypothetical protein
MSHINIKIKPQKTAVSTVSFQKTAVSSISFGAPAKLSLSQIIDVDASNPKDNDVLVYEEDSNKYVIKTLPVVQGGKF